MVSLGSREAAFCGIITLALRLPCKIEIGPRFIGSEAGVWFCKVTFKIGGWFSSNVLFSRGWVSFVWFEIGCVTFSIWFVDGVVTGTVVLFIVILFSCGSLLGIFSL